MPGKRGVAHARCADRVQRQRSVGECTPHLERGNYSYSAAQAVAYAGVGSGKQVKVSWGTSSGGDLHRLPAQGTEYSQELL